MREGVPLVAFSRPIWLPAVAPLALIDIFHVPLRPTSAEHRSRGNPRNLSELACRTGRVWPGLPAAVSGTWGSRRSRARPSTGIASAYRGQMWKVSSVEPHGSPRTLWLHLLQRTGRHAGLYGTLRNSEAFP